MVLATASSAAGSPFAEEVGQRLATRGEGPCAMTLATKADAHPIALDVVATHGALIEWRRAWIQPGK
jgi:hypothetical protein